MEDSTNKEQNLAFTLLETTGENLFLTGKAGTGKTAFLRNLRDRSMKRLVVLAPTGIAAINAGGMTIHSFFQLSFGPFVPGKGFPGHAKRYDRFSREKLRVIRTMDLLVIDEISMVRADLLDAVDDVLRRHRDPTLPFGGVQLLMIGDLAQLPPVVRDEDWKLLHEYYDTPFFFSSIALRQTSYQTIEFKKVYRQEEDTFLDMLNRIRENRMDDHTFQNLNQRYIAGFDPPSDEHWIRLVTHNHQADGINTRQMELLSTPGRTFTADITGDFPESSYPADKELTLKIGAQVMFIKNDTAEHRFYNGLLGEVTGFRGDGVTVAPADGTAAIFVEPQTWENARYSVDAKTQELKEETAGEFTQIPLRKAWAITIHKSQGLTFDRALIDASSSFTHGQTYVALSRCRTLGGLVLGRPLGRSSLICDETVVSYLRRRLDDAPDAGRLLNLQRAYVISLLDSLFNLRPLLRAMEPVSRLMLSDFQSIYKNLTQRWQEACDHVKTLQQVASKFGVQYRRLLSNPGAKTSTPETDTRLRQGASYFLAELEFLHPLMTQTPKDHDNKETAKRMKTAFEDLKSELAVRLDMLGHVADKGMKVTDFLQERAKSVLRNEQRTSPIRKPRRSGGKSAESPVQADMKSGVDTSPASSCGSPEKSMATAESDDIRDQALFGKLRIWRLEEARKIGKPAFVVMPNKTLVNIVNANPSTFEELMNVNGISAIKAAQYGTILLAILETHRQY